MKKLLSLALAALMAVSAFAVSALPAMAKETVNSPSAVVVVSPLTQVNGEENSINVTFVQSVEDPYLITFYYDGRGILEYWEHNLQTLGFTEGTDYTTSEGEDGSFTIKFISDAAKEALSDDKVIVNAEVAIANPSTQLNGETNDTNITFTQDPENPYSILFEYNGDGTLVGWEHNLDKLGYVEGKDYTVVENADGSLTITFVSEDAKESLRVKDVVVNAIVEFGEGQETTDTVTDSATGTTGTTTGTTNKNDSAKAPATGLATSAVAGSIALAAAGFAVLSAKKKEEK